MAFVLAGARVCVLGAAYKPNSDDVRDSPALAAAGALTIIPGALVIYFVRNYIAKGFALGRV